MLGRRTLHPALRVAHISGNGAWLGRAWQQRQEGCETIRASRSALPQIMVLLTPHRAVGCLRVHYSDALERHKAEPQLTKNLLEPGVKSGTLGRNASAFAIPHTHTAGELQLAASPEYSMSLSLRCPNRGASSKPSPHLN